MALAARTFRVFVSSTFSDLKGERNVLQEKVFPRLRQLAASNGCRFQAIDLRWGVSEEAALDQQAMKICIEEIHRCQKASPRPNFIILLGNRYGWRPLPCEIEAGEFNLLLEYISIPDRSFLMEWYKIDENAIPAVFILQPRKGSSRDKRVWETIETRLHEMLEVAAQKARLPEQEMLKYTTSATEQEIIQGAFQVVDARQHVFCYAREFSGQVERELSPEFFDPEAGSLLLPAAARLADLKSRLKAILGKNYKEYFAAWEQGHPTLTHLYQLCEDVYRDLESIMLREITGLEKVLPIDREILAHRAFGEQRSHHFVGRKDMLKKIDDYLDSADNHPLVVWGISGLGKSALMAKAAQEARQKHPRSVVISRFAGVTPESSGARSLLSSLCQEIQRANKGDESPLPSGYEDLQVHFQGLLGEIPQDHSLVIFMDALDQLREAEAYQATQWLPTELPPRVKVVVSTLPGDCLAALGSRLPMVNQLELKPMPPVESVQLLDLWLAEAGRCLQEDQRLEVMKYEADFGNPLYLNLVFEEVRRWHSYDGVPEGRAGARRLGVDIPSILNDLLWRLSQDSYHGKALLEHSLGALAAARNGLSEDELLDVLSTDPDVLADFKRRSPESPVTGTLPAVIWSRLRSDLDPYLTEREADHTTLLAFYHPTSFGAAVKENYLPGSQKAARHRSLAKYFMAQPLVIEHSGQKKINLRKTSELVYQQRQAEMWDDLFASLTSFDFLEARCRAASVQDLEEDYERALEGWDRPGAQAVMAFAREVRLNSHTIQAHPETLFTQLYNALTWVDAAEDGLVHQACEQGRQGRQGWLRAVKEIPPRLKTEILSIEGPGEVIEMALTLDGCRALVSAEDETVIRLFNLGTGQFEGKFVGHVNEIHTLAVSPDGRTVISGSEDDTIKIWDLPNTRLLRTLEHSGGVKECAITPDGQTIVAANNEDEIRVWDLVSGRLKATWTCSEDAYEFALPDGGDKVITFGNQGIHIWSLMHGDLLNSYEEASSVNTLALSPDNRSAVYYTGDGTLWQLDLENGKTTEICSMSGVEGMRLTIIPGRWAVFESKDALLYVVDLQNPDAKLSELKGHTDNITGVESLGSEELVTASKDGSIKIWDVPGSLEKRSITGPGRTANVRFSMDGRKLISSSGTEIMIWNLADGKQVSRIINTEEFPLEVLSMEGALLFLGAESTLEVWDLETMSLMQVLDGDQQSIHEIAASWDGSTIAAFTQIDDDHVHVSTWKQREAGLAIYERQHTFTIVRSGLDVNSHFRPAVKITPDGQKIAFLTGEEEDICIWDLPGNCLAASLCGQKGWIKGLAISPDGTLLASGSDNGSLWIWDFYRATCIRKIKSQTASFGWMTFSPDSRLLLTHEANTESLVVWDARKGRRLHTLREPAGLSRSNSIYMACVSPDGKVLAASTSLDAIRVWDLQALDKISMYAHADEVNSLAIDLPRMQMVSASKDKCVKLWDLITGVLKATMEDWDGSGGMALSPDGSQIVISAGSSWVDVWDLDARQRKHSYSIKDPFDDMRSFALSMHPSRRFVVHMWSTKTGQEFLEVYDLDKGHPYEVETGDVDYADKVDTYGDRWSLPAAFADGKRIVHGMDHQINIWDLEKREVVHSWDGKDGTVLEVALTREDGTVISLSDDNFLRFWNAANGRLIKEAEVKRKIHSLQVTQNGSGLIYLSANSCARMDLVSGESTLLFTHDADLTTVVVSKDCQYVILGDKVGRILTFEWIH